MAENISKDVETQTINSENSRLEGENEIFAQSKKEFDQIDELLVDMEYQNGVSDSDDDGSFPRVDKIKWLIQEYNQIRSSLNLNGSLDGENKDNKEMEDDKKTNEEKVDNKESISKIGFMISEYAGIGDNDEVERLKGEVEELKRSKVSSMSQIKELEGEIKEKWSKREKEMEGREKEVRDENDKLRGELGEMRGKNESLRSQLEEIVNEYDKLERELKDFKSNKGEGKMGNGVVGSLNNSLNQTLNQTSNNQSEEKRSEVELKSEFEKERDDLMKRLQAQENEEEMEEPSLTRFFI